MTCALVPNLTRLWSGLVCACLGLSVSSFFWGLGDCVSHCGTPWAFLLPFLLKFYMWFSFALTFSFVLEPLSVFHHSFEKVLFSVWIQYWSRKTLCERKIFVYLALYQDYAGGLNSRKTKFKPLTVLVPICSVMYHWFFFFFFFFFFFCFLFLTIMYV